MKTECERREPGIGLKLQGTVGYILQSELGCIKSQEPVVSGRREYNSVNCSSGDWRSVHRHLPEFEPHYTNIPHHPMTGREHFRGLSSQPV